MVVPSMLATTAEDAESWPLWRCCAPSGFGRVPSDAAALRESSWGFGREADLVHCFHYTPSMDASPDRVQGYTWHQVRSTFGVVNTLLMSCSQSHDQVRAVARGRSRPILSTWL